MDKTDASNVGSLVSKSDAGHLPERRWAMVEFAIVVVRFVLYCVCVWSVPVRGAYAYAYEY